MKRCILLMTAFMGLMSLESQAQSKERPAANKEQKVQATPEEQAERQTKKAASELGLTTDQQAKFKTFALERNTTVRPLHEKMRNTQDREERKKLHGEVKAANEKFDANVKSILTAEQLPRWDARKEQSLEKRKAHQKERREMQDGN